MSTTRQAGRPIRQSELEVNKTIRENFEAGIGIMAVHYTTGYCTRTISKRYDKWNKLLKEREDVQFLQRQDEAKAHALLALDKQILEVLELQKLLKESPNLSLRLKVADVLFDMTDRKASLEFTPTIASRVKAEVKELIAKYQKQPLTERELQTGK